MSGIKYRIIMVGYIIPVEKISKSKIVTDWSHNTENCEFKTTEWMSDPEWIGRYCPFCGIIHRRYEYELIPFADLKIYFIDSDNNCAVGKVVRDVTYAKTFYEITLDELVDIQTLINSQFAENGLSIPAEDVSIIFIPLGEDSQANLLHY